jgi:hypothetical protein
MGYLAHVGPNRDVYEWWPDYGQGPLWLRTTRGGVAVDLGSLNLPDSLGRELTSWNASYEEARIPGMDSEGDTEWLAHGVRLLAETRAALAGRGEVIVTEPWWE